MSAKGTILKKAFDNIGKASSVAVPAYFAVDEYKRARDEGKGVISSAVRGVTDFAIGEALGGWYMPYMLATAVPSMAVTAYQTLDQANRQATLINQNTPFINNKFYDTQQAYTMRQQGMQLAKASKYNLEQTLMGNEASHFRL